MHSLRETPAMPSPHLPAKRPSPADTDTAPSGKRPKHYYHHHHRLQEPVILPQATEPAVQDEANVDRLMNRTLGQLLRDAGFDLADPAALSSLRSATEEYLLRFSTHVRQSMIASRRLQPIPQDFEHALERSHLHPDHLRPYLKSLPPTQPVPTLLPSPPPEDGGPQKLLILNSLSGEDEDHRSHRLHIPKHFPDFPSKHTYSATAVFTERESDPRKIRERAAEDGRHGEEALRKLARAAFRDNQLGSTGRDKKLWGRRMESMDSMFEKTVKGLAKKLQKDPLATSTVGAATNTALELDSGLPVEAEAKTRSKVSWSVELGPIVNCERDLWRRSTASGSRRATDKMSKSTASVEPVDTVGDA